MARTLATKLHLLTVREVQAAPDGDHSDGGGLLLRVRRDSASWVLRYTAHSGERREMGLGVARRNNAAATGDSLTTARRLAHEARDLLQRGGDPIDDRDSRRTVAKQSEQAQRAEKRRTPTTLARAARGYHERVIEPTRTSKHAAQWIASLENHIPAALWQAPISEIEPPALLAALSSLRPHGRARNVKGDRVPETLQRVRQRLDAVFEDAFFHKLRTSNPAAAIRRKLREAQERRQRGELKAPGLQGRAGLRAGTAAGARQCRALLGECLRLLTDSAQVETRTPVCLPPEGWAAELCRAGFECRMHHRIRQPEQVCRVDKLDRFCTAADAGHVRAAGREAWVGRPRMASLMQTPPA